MSDPQTFDNIDEAFAYMYERERKANENLRPRQRSIGFDQYVIRDMGDFMIFGHILPKAERDQGEDPETILQLDETRARGYHYGIHYSVHCPEGEYGDVHAANVWPITKEDFETAKSFGWSVERWIVEDNDSIRFLVDRIRTEMSEENSNG